MQSSGTRMQNVAQPRKALGGHTPMSYQYSESKEDVPPTVVSHYDHELTGTTFLSALTQVLP
jgi:hypothetical protein